MPEAFGDRQCPPGSPFKGLTALYPSFARLTGRGGRLLALANGQLGS
jgi:hypothetical protein